MQFVQDNQSRRRRLSAILVIGPITWKHPVEFLERGSANCRQQQSVVLNRSLCLHFTVAFGIPILEDLDGESLVGKQRKIRNDLIPQMNGQRGNCFPKLYPELLVRGVCLDHGSYWRIR